MVLTLGAPIVYSITSEVISMNKKNEAIQRYQDKNIRRYNFKVNRKTESDILEQIEKQDNMQGYIKRLIREDIERNK